MQSCGDQINDTKCQIIPTPCFYFGNHDVVMRQMMKFGYGVSDFGKIILTLESAGEQLIFNRPRRFGKSLLLSMLSYYYDVNYAEDFETLFGKLALGKNPT